MKHKTKPRSEATSRNDEEGKQKSSRNEGTKRAEAQPRLTQRKSGKINSTHPPLKRPSVKQATSKPNPAPMIKLVGFNISGIPRLD